MLNENMLNCCFYPFDWFCHPQERKKHSAKEHVDALMKSAVFFHFNDSTVAITRSFGTAVIHLITGKEHFAVGYAGCFPALMREFALVHPAGSHCL